MVLHALMAGTVPAVPHLVRQLRGGAHLLPSVRALLGLGRGGASALGTGGGAMPGARLSVPAVTALA